MKFFSELKKKILDYLNLAPAKTYIDVEDFGRREDNWNWQYFIDDKMQRNASDKNKYADYNLMDAEIPEISSALDVMADFVVYPDNVNRNQVFEVQSKKYNDKIKDITKRTKFAYEFHSMIRDCCKYGDNFEEILTNVNRNMILGFKNVPIETVFVNMKNGLIQDSPMIRQMGNDNKEIAKLNANECIHFCLNTERRKYFDLGKGISRIEKARLIYRQLRLMEEGLMIRRLSNANLSYGISVDVGDLMGDEVFSYLDKYKKRLSRKKYIDSATGRFSYKVNPLTAVEDLLVPTRQGSGGGNIVPLNINDVGKNIEDINYFQNKMIYACGVPKLLIGKEDDVNSKSSSDVQYTAFLRAIRRIQTIVEPEIIRFYQNALLLEGFEDDTLSVYWPIFGTIDEERKWRIEQLKMSVATSLSKDMSLVDDYYIYKNFMGLTDEEIETLTDRMDDEEQKYKDEMEAELADAVYDPNLGSNQKSDNTSEIPSDNKKKTKEYFINKLDAKTYETFDKMIELANQDENIKEQLLCLIELIKMRGIK